MWLYSASWTRHLIQLYLCWPTQHWTQAMGKKLTWLSFTKPYIYDWSWNPLTTKIKAWELSWPCLGCWGTLLKHDCSSAKEATWLAVAAGHFRHFFVSNGCKMFLIAQVPSLPFHLFFFFLFSLLSVIASQFSFSPTLSRCDIGKYDCFVSLCPFLISLSRVVLNLFKILFSMKTFSRECLFS